MAWLDVAEAAERLDVDARQVRRLLAGGDLVGRRIGRVWIVDADSVRERRRQNPVRGRPLAAAKAWAVLEQVGRHLPGSRLSIAEHPALDLAARWAPPVDRWPSWLRSRTRRQHLYLHPGLLDRFDADPAVRCVDVASVLGLSTVLPIRFVSAEDFDAVLDRQHADLDPAGPVEVQVLPPLPDFPDDQALVAAAIVAQLSSPNARVRHLAHISVQSRTNRP